MSRRAIQRRAMTLIEVLAATVLLALLGSACASLLRSAPVMPADPAADTTSIDMLALEGAADELLDDQRLRERLIADAISEFSVPWPDEPARPAIQIRRVEQETSVGKPAHAWIALSCGQFVVWRCVQLSKERSIP